MRIRTFLAATFVAAPFLATAAWAGPFRDYESALRQTYGQYRVALFATNANKSEEAAKSVVAFLKGWSELAARGVPPQYEDDPGYAGAMAEVANTARTAESEIVAGKLTAAHETLETIRDVIGHLHQRNGVIGFSDHMNAFHEVMEHVLGQAAHLQEPATLPKLRNDMAVLSYLARQLATPPADAGGGEAYGNLYKALQDSIATVQAALDKGDQDNLKKAISGLKPPYARLFLQFG